jgi:hypothetical protein
MKNSDALLTQETSIPFGADKRKKNYLDEKYVEPFLLYYFLEN